MPRSVKDAQGSVLSQTLELGRDGHCRSFETMAGETGRVLIPARYGESSREAARQQPHGFLLQIENEPAHDETGMASSANWSRTNVARIQG